MPRVPITVLEPNVDSLDCPVNAGSAEPWPKFEPPKTVLVVDKLDAVLLSGAFKDKEPETDVIAEARSAVGNMNAEFGQPETGLVPMFDSPV